MVCMRNIDNALQDTLDTMGIARHIHSYIREMGPTQWRVVIRHNQISGSLLEVEITHDEDGDPIGAVLQRVRISERTMNVFMDTFLDFLEDWEDEDGGTSISSETASELSPLEDIPVE